MMADGKTESLEKRIEILENNVFGDADKDAVYPKVVDTLGNLKQQLTAAFAGRKKVEPVMKRLGELNDYLDPTFTEPLTLSREAKTEMILAEEAFIRQTADNLEKVKDMTELLGSEHIKVVPALETKLQELSKIHIKQQDEACEFSEEVKNLFLQYNNIITLLSKQFVQWDETISRLEMAAQTTTLED